jgi:putative redox protein
MMKVNLRLDRKMRIVGTNEKGHETIFDTVPKVGGEDTAATPMEVMLQAMAACSFMDVISILRKKRKTIDALNIEIEAERADEHPKVFTKAILKYTLKSPDAELKDLERSVELSQDNYCGASAMFKKSGCEVGWEAQLEN